MTEHRAPRLVRLVLLASLLAYAPSLGNGFALDDHRVAESKTLSGQPMPMIHDPQPIAEFFKSHWWRDTAESSALYRPVTKLSFAWTYQTFGDKLVSEAFPHHLINVLLHVLATWLVFVLLRRVGAPETGALLAALVFAVHAIHTEVVATIVGRAELFAFCFGAGATLLLLRDARTWRLVLAGLLLFFAFCSKESAVAWATFFPIVVLARRWLRPDENPPDRARWARVAAALIVPLVVFLAARHAALSTLPEPRPPAAVANPLAHAGTFERVLTALTIWGYGLGKTLLPFGLSSDYGAAVFDTVPGITSPRFLLSLVVLLGVVVVSFVVARCRPLVFLAMASFFGFSALTSNVLFAIGTQFGERLYYTPSLGVAFLAAAVLGSGRWRKPVLIAIGAWCAYNAVYSFDRSFAWRDSRTVSRLDLATQPRSAALQRRVAGERAAEGDSAGALRLLEEAVRLEPRFAEAWSLLAHLHGQSGDLDAMAAATRNAVAATFPEQRQLRATLHLNLARRATAARDWDRALAAARAAYLASPHQIAPAVRRLVAQVAGDGAVPPPVRSRARTMLSELR